MMSRNDDLEIYRTARRVLDGKHTWLEEGMATSQPVELPADDWPSGPIHQQEERTAPAFN
jgi:hypothetical protein